MFHKRKKPQIKEANRLLNLGNCHKFGIGTKVNHKEAFKNYEEASELGNLIAKIRLADCYLNGEGVKQNQEIAFKMYQEVFGAIPDSSPMINIKARAAAKLGSCYMDGEGVKRNDELAYSYFELAVSKDDVYGHLGLATCYMEGIGCDQDSKKAIENYNEAIRLFALIDIYELINYFREKKEYGENTFFAEIKQEIGKIIGEEILTTSITRKQISKIQELLKGYGPSLFDLEIPESSRDVVKSPVEPTRTPSPTSSKVKAGISSGSRTGDGAAHITPNKSQQRKIPTPEDSDRGRE